MLSIWNTLFLNTLNTHAPIKENVFETQRLPGLLLKSKSLCFERDNLKKKLLYQKLVALGNFTRKHGIKQTIKFVKLSEITISRILIQVKVTQQRLGR